MQFIRCKRNKIYPMWTARYYTLRIHISMLVVTEVFHFTVTEDGKTLYSCLNHGICFTEFEDTAEAVGKWIKKNVQ